MFFIPSIYNENYIQIKFKKLNIQSYFQKKCHDFNEESYFKAYRH